MFSMKRLLTLGAVTILLVGMAVLGIAASQPLYQRRGLRFSPMLPQLLLQLTN